jgi:hypothetical protein
MIMQSREPLDACIVHSIGSHKVFVDGADVCRSLVCNTRIAERQRTLVAQWSRLEGGRIRRIEVLLGAHQYKVMFPVSDPDGGSVILRFPLPSERQACEMSD